MKDKASYRATFKEEDGKAVMVRFRFGPITRDPAEIVQWMIDHADGPALAAVLDLFDTKAENEIWKSDIEYSLEEYKGHIQKSAGKGFARPLIGGAVHVEKLVSGEGFIEVFGQVTFDTDTCRWAKFLERTKDLEPLASFKKGDGTHRGLFDFYERNEKEIKKAIKSGKAFTTGTYGSKHEIASGRFTTDGKGMHCAEAWVSNDYETPGQGDVRSTETLTYDLVQKMILEAHEKAVTDQDNRAQVAVYKVLNGKDNWCETYLAAHNDCDLDEPPGDDNINWGWQEEGEIPEDIKAFFEKKILRGEVTPEKPAELATWTLEVHYG